MINILIVAHEKNIRRTPGESLRECHLESAVYERGAGVGHQVQLGEETARGVTAASEPDKYTRVQMDSPVSFQPTA